MNKYRVSMFDLNDCPSNQVISIKFRSFQSHFLALLNADVVIFGIA